MGVPCHNAAQHPARRSSLLDTIKQPSAMSDTNEKKMGEERQRLDSLKSIHTWEIASHTASVASPAASRTSNVTVASSGHQGRVEGGGMAAAAGPVSPLRSAIGSNRRQQQSEWFLVRWLLVHGALWMSLLSWIGRCFGIRTNCPLPVLDDSGDGSHFFQLEVTTGSSGYGSHNRGGGSVMDTTQGSLAVDADVAGVDAKLNLEKYCLLIKKQLASREIVLGPIDKKKLGKKCDYLLQWMERNPHAKREDYIRGLDDVMRYSDKLLSRAPSVCPVM